MRKLSRTSRRAVLAGGIALLAAPAVPAIAGSTRTIPGTTLFVSGEQGYHTVRGPSLVKAPNGDLFAFAQGRVDNNLDYGNVDILMRRSTDGGQTWKAMNVLWSDGQAKIGPFAPVVDQASGDIIMLAIRTAGYATPEQINKGEVPWEDSRRPFVIRGTYNQGKGHWDWSDPVDISESVKPRNWRHFVLGPGHAIQLTRGPHAGRIVVPGNHTAEPTDGSDGTQAHHHCVHLIYSDDGGHTWQLGATDEATDDSINGGESQVVELTDGTVYQNMRDQAGSASGNRAYVTSSDGGASYDGPPEPETQLETAIVQGTVQRVFAKDQGDDSDLLVFSCAKDLDPDDEMSRQHMVLWRSTDEARTWEEALTVWDGRAAYSDMVKLSNDRLGLLYEAGNKTPYKEISFARVLIDNLMP